MTMKKMILGSVALTMALGAAPQQAAAFGGAGRATESTQRRVLDAVNDVRESVQETRDAVNDVRQEVRESANRLIAALRAHSGEQSAYQDKQIEASRRIEDAAQLNDSNRLRQEFRAEAESGEYDPSPDICLLAGLFRSNGAAPTEPRGSSTVGAARARASGGDEAVRAGGAALDRAIVDDRSTYAGALGGYPDPTTNPAAILERPTLALETAEDQAAAERLILNLTDPLPPRPVTEEEMRTPEGVARAARRTIQETRANAGAEVISMVMNMRSEVGPTEPWQPYLDDISNYNRPVGDQLSELQSIDIRTLRHYAPKPEVFHKRASWTSKQILMELLDAVAIGNRLAYMQLELDSRTAVVQTQILSALSND